MDDSNPIQNQNPAPYPLRNEPIQNPAAPEPPQEFSLPMSPAELPSAYNEEQLPASTEVTAGKPAAAQPEPAIKEEHTAQPVPLQPEPAAQADAHQHYQHVPQNKPPFDKAQGKQMPEAIFHIEIEKIKSNPHQPRRDFDEGTLKELATSIQEFGILQPLVVSKVERDTATGTAVEYQLIAGERRLRAAQMLGWERVPVIIRSTVVRSEQLEMAIVENLQRENLTPIETARAYAKLQDEFGLTQREVAARLGKSRETIANTLRLLNLPSDIQEAISKNQLSESQGRLLLMLADPKEQHHLFEELLNRTMTVRELQGRVHKNAPVRHRARTASMDPEIKIFEEELRELLGANVKIEKEKTGDAGKIIITFYSPEEIESIIHKLNPPS